MSTKTENNLEVMMKAIIGLTKRMDAIEAEPIVEVRNEFRFAVPNSVDIASVSQDDWGKLDDEQQLAIAATKPNVDELISEVKSRLGLFRSRCPGGKVCFATLVEQVGELSSTLITGNRHEVREAATDMAALALKIVMDGDESLNDHRTLFGLDALTDE